MLVELAIQNLALIDDLEVQCEAGFNVLTGETGAGKSMLMQALALLLGERADTESLGQDSKRGKTRVEGIFDIQNVPGVLQYLQENDIPTPEAQLLISRIIGKDGRSKVRINGQLSTVTALKELGTLLVDLHGQHDHQHLLRPQTHREFLDAAGDKKHRALLDVVAAAFKEWKQARAHLEQITGDAQQRAQRLDMLTFQMQDIDETAPQAEEEELLREERERLLNMEKLRENAGACQAALHGNEDGQGGAVELLAEAVKNVAQLSQIDASVQQWHDELQNAYYALEEAAAGSSSYLEGLESNPHRLEEIESRLHDLGRLKRKYGNSVAAVLEYYEAISQEVTELSVSDEQVEELQQQCAQLLAEYHKQAKALTVLRRKLGGQLSKEILTQLKDMAMPKAQFEVQLEESPEPSMQGGDKVEFFFSANPGMAGRALSKVASGGEISRLMLALRIVLARHDTGAGKYRVPVLVFDEIDAGVGGETAEAVGQKMQELGNTFQVICITHLPQIARRAARHLGVVKSSKANDTNIAVQPLEGEERVREIARMMGHKSTANLEHARQLLEEKM